MPAFDRYRDHPRHPRQGGWIAVLIGHHLAEIAVALLVITLIGLLFFALGPAGAHILI